jgi:hypothetical protein
VTRAVWLVLLAAGCNQVLGVTDPHLHDGDAGPGPGSDGAMCAGDGFGYAISNVASCDIPPAVVDLPFLGATGTSTIDTTAGTLTIGPATVPLPSTMLVAQPGGPQVRVVSLTSLDVPAGVTLNVVGQYGLVLVVRGDVTIDGQLLASANHTTPAAGSRTAAACDASAGVVGVTGLIFMPGDISGGSGGGGHGGSGAAGGSGLTGATSGGPGGIADANLALRPLRGGCPGGVRSGGTPAAGGGAIQISASGRINITGAIAAGGGGGLALDITVPAPAGGSGGGILLEAIAIAMDSKAALTANGGGGADGSDTAAACSGENGHPRNAIPAAGGNCSADITGGAGGAGTTPAHGGDSGTRGTGGGGGVGRIAIHSPAFTPGIVSPPANVEPF